LEEAEVAEFICLREQYRLWQVLIETKYSCAADDEDTFAWFVCARLPRVTILISMSVRDSLRTQNKAHETHRSLTSAISKMT
jgi:hypothetical protein